MIKTKQVFYIGLACLVWCLTFAPAAAAKPNPENGVKREYHSNGNLRFVTKFKHGLVLRHRTYYRDGTRQMDVRYKNGKVIFRKMYHENGRLKSVWLKKTEELRFYDKNGRLVSTVATKGTDPDALKPSYFYSTE